jgi:hypothetical protein
VPGGAENQPFFASFGFVGFAIPDGCEFEHEHLPRVTLGFIVELAEKLDGILAGACKNLVPRVANVRAGIELHAILLLGGVCQIRELKTAYREGEVGAAVLGIVAVEVGPLVGAGLHQPAPELRPQRSETIKVSAHKIVIAIDHGYLQGIFNLVFKTGPIYWGEKKGHPMSPGKSFLMTFID